MRNLGSTRDSRLWVSVLLVVIAIKFMLLLIALIRRAMLRTRTIAIFIIVCAFLLFVEGPTLRSQSKNAVCPTIRVLAGLVSCSHASRETEMPIQAQYTCVNRGPPVERHVPSVLRSYRIMDRKPQAQSEELWKI